MDFSYCDAYGLTFTLLCVKFHLPFSYQSIAQVYSGPVGGFVSQQMFGYFCIPSSHLQIVLSDYECLQL